MPSQQDLEKFMQDTMFHRGQTDSRLQSMEALLLKMDVKLTKVCSQISMAHGGWVAIMALVGVVTSAAGVIMGLYKLFMHKMGAS